MDQILDNQREFFKNGQTKDLKYRKRKLKDLRQNILLFQDEIVQALYQDFKKSSFESMASEVGVVIDELNLHIKKLTFWAKPKRIQPVLVNFPSTAKIYPEAYGQILIISPWNYPFNLAITPLIGAVAAGNTAVIKASEYAPHTAKVIAKIIAKSFDKQHVTVIEGDASTAQKLLELKWNYIFFTGSSVVGKYVYQAAAKNLTPVSLELGGKSPVIIDKTANLKLAAKRIVWGKFLNAGQTCIAPDYVLIPSKISTEFIAFLKTEIVSAYGENPEKSKDYPRIINTKNFNRLQRMLQDPQLVFGGKTNSDDLYISPSIILNPEAESEIMQYEIFGPILPIITYDTQEEMEHKLQENQNPLAFYIFSNDKKMQKYLINKYPFGGGVINDVIVHFINNRLPFGGVGDSGLGSYHGKHSFDTFSHHKSMVKRANWLDIPIRYVPSSKLKHKLLKFFLMR